MTPRQPRVPTSVLLTLAFAATLTGVFLLAETGDGIWLIVGLLVAVACWLASEDSTNTRPPGSP